MEIRHYLALTASEFTSAADFPSHCAWMACHFSPYGTGLSNLPCSLPENSLLTLNDRISFQEHNPERIREQLIQAASTLKCSAVLLDFQQENSRELKELAAYLSSGLPCPTVVSDSYADGLDCPVFLGPCPHHIALPDHTAPWHNRELWLDLAMNAEIIFLTDTGASIHDMPWGEIPEGGFADTPLHCHYAMETGKDSARFRLWRTQEDLQALKDAAITLGIRNFVGLYQEFHRKPAK